MKVFASIFSLGLVALLTGCVRLEEELILKENGSGTLELKYSIAEQAIDQLASMDRLKKDLDAARTTNAQMTAAAELSRFLFNPQKDEIVQKLKTYEPLGIVTEKVEIKSQDIRRNVNVKVRFDSLATLAKTDLFQAYGFSVRKTAKGDYSFEREPAIQNALVKPDMSDPETVKMVSPLLSGFNVSVSLSTPTRIVQTTGVAVGPYTTAWNFDFDRNPSALTLLQSQRFGVVIEGDGLTLPEINLSAAPGAQPAAGGR